MQQPRHLHCMLGYYMHTDRVQLTNLEAVLQVMGQRSLIRSTSEDLVPGGVRSIRSQEIVTQLRKSPRDHARVKTKQQTP